MSNGLVVIGRAERMGLGTHTEEFCAAMNPDKVIIIDRENGRPLFADRIKNSVVAKWRWRLPYETPIPQLHKELEGAKVVVGFETWYDNSVPEVCRRIGARSALFPMHESSSFEQCRQTDVLLCLSQTDMNWAHDVVCSPLPPGRMNPVKSVLCDWPASPFVRQKCGECQGAGQRRFYIGHGDSGDEECPVCGGSGFHRKINWPPRTFVHLAGNAGHNRDGTKQVLQAAKWLKGTGAKLRVHASFSGVLDWLPNAYDMPELEICGPVESRADLLKDCDVLVPTAARLPGHSLPINEATGEGIPVIMLDLPDWAAYPYRVTAHPDGKFATGSRLHDAWRCDPNVLGHLMQNLATTGEDSIDRLPTVIDTVRRCPHLPSWEEFRTKFWEWVK